MKRKAVYTRFGEVSYTPASFNCFLDDFRGNLNEKKCFLFSSDDWRLTPPEPVHKVVEVDIPDWIPERCHANYLTAYDDLGQALRVIERYPGRPFYQSLLAFLRNKGYFTPRQIDAVLYPTRYQSRKP